jgi:hypothetical protein
MQARPQSFFWFCTRPEDGWMRNSENFDSADPLFRRSRNSKTFGLLMLRPFGPSQLAPSVLAPWCFQPVAFRDVILMNRRTFRQFHSERLYAAGSRFSRNIACPVYGFRGAIAERGVGTGECERSEHEKLEEFRGGNTPPSPPDGGRAPVLRTVALPVSPPVWR